MKRALLSQLRTKIQLTKRKVPNKEINPAEKTHTSIPQWFQNSHLTRNSTRGGTKDHFISKIFSYRSLFANYNSKRTNRNNNSSTQKSNGHLTSSKQTNSATSLCCTKREKNSWLQKSLKNH